MKYKLCRDAGARGHDQGTCHQQGKDGPRQHFWQLDLLIKRLVWGSLFQAICNSILDAAEIMNDVLANNWIVLRF